MALMKLPMYAKNGHVTSPNRLGEKSGVIDEFGKCCKFVLQFIAGVLVKNPVVDEGSQSYFCQRWVLCYYPESFAPNASMLWDTGDADHMIIHNLFVCLFVRVLLILVTESLTKAVCLDSWMSKVIRLLGSQFVQILRALSATHVEKSI